MEVKVTLSAIGICKSKIVLAVQKMANTDMHVFHSHPYFITLFNFLFDLFFSVSFVVVSCTGVIYSAISQCAGHGGAKPGRKTGRAQKQIAQRIGHQPE